MYCLELKARKIQNITVSVRAHLCPFRAPKKLVHLVQKNHKALKKKCFIPNELTLNCKLKFLPASLWLSKAYCGIFKFFFNSYFLFFFLLKSVS